MTEKLTSDFEKMRDDIFSSVNALIHQLPADTPPVLPAPALVLDTSMKCVDNSNSEMLILLSNYRNKFPR